MISDSPKQQQNKPFGIEDQMTSRQTQAVPIAYVCGTRKIALTWASRIYNLIILPAQGTPGKK